MTDTTQAGYCRRAIVLIAAGFLLGGCSDPLNAPRQPGEAEYIRYCSSCHARDGTGRAPNFPPLAGSEWLEMGPEAISLIVLLGLRGEIEVAGRAYRGYMPPMGQLKDMEINQILTYIDQQWAQWERLPESDEIGALRRRTEDAGVLEGRADLEQLLKKVAP